MINKFKKYGSLKVADVLRVISVFDLFLILLIIFVPVAVFAAKGGNRKPPKDDTQTSPVKIYDIDPASGPIGTNITINGSGFTTDNSIVIKGKTIATGISSPDGTTINFVLPPEAPCRPPKACPLKVYVSNSKGISNAVPFKVTHDVLPELTIITDQLPGGVENIYYETALEAEGGTLPYTWSVTAGVLPLGLALDPASGVISGTPITSGVSNFIVKVVDFDQISVSKTFEITIEPSNIPFDTLTIRGRFIDYFTHEPIEGVNFVRNAKNQDAIIQPSNENGEFSIVTTVNELVPGGTSALKAFWYYPYCYKYAQSISIHRQTDFSLRVDSNLFDLNDNPILYPVTGPEIDLGDVTIWPATGVQMYFDQELQPTIRYPEEGKSMGNINFMMDTVGYLGGNIIPFDYPLTIELTDRDGNVYTSPPHEHSRTHGCDTSLIVNFSNGAFSFNPSGPVTDGTSDLAP